MRTLHKTLEFDPHAYSHGVVRPGYAAAFTRGGIKEDSDQDDHECGQACGGSRSTRGRRIKGGRRWVPQKHH